MEVGGEAPLPDDVVDPVTAIQLGILDQMKLYWMYLRHVHEMGTEGGTLALVAEAHYERLDLPPEYHALAGPEARALWFLTYLPAVFHAARLQHTADHLADRHSTAVAGLPEGIPPHSLAELGEFRRALAEYFLLT